MKVYPFNLDSCNEAANLVIPVPLLVLIVLLWDVCAWSCGLISLFFWGPSSVHNVMSEYMHNVMSEYMCILTRSNVGSHFYFMMKHWRWSHFCVIFLPRAIPALAAQNFEVNLYHAVW